MSNSEPTDEQVNQFIREHPSGGTLDDIADFLGISKQRANQLVMRAIDKVRNAVQQRGLTLNDLTL